MSESPRILIIGAGPAGLGAAWRLEGLGHENFIVCEARERVGGLSASIVDGAGFTWDIGGHVAFSHFKEFDRFFAQFAPDALSHEREAWIWMKGRWIPYPFQNNLRYLPRETMLECVEGLVEAAAAPSAGGGGGLPNFAEWMVAWLGEGVCRHFMRPDIAKRWAYPPERMSAGWIAERVSVVDLKRLLRNIILERDDVSWGPNHRFRFPLRGGTGAIYERCAATLGDRVRLGRRARAIHAESRRVTFDDGSTETADAIISTTPLDRLMDGVSDAPERLRDLAAGLEHNALYCVGVGLARSVAPAVGSKCWMYFPEDDCPFYRVTNFSRYSPNNVPGGDTSRFSALMCETSASEHRPVDRDRIVEETVAGLIRVGLMNESDRDRIVTTTLIHEPYSYPIPTLDRDAILTTVLPWLEARGVHSIGRFGAWRYEEGNMDHCVMAGVRAADRALEGARR